MAFESIYVEPSHFELHPIRGLLVAIETDCPGDSAIHVKSDHSILDIYTGRWKNRWIRWKNIWRNTCKILESPTGITANGNLLTAE